MAPKIKAVSAGVMTDYGYWWWLHPAGYSAEGWGGQMIMVAPVLDLVVVFTAADFNAPRNLYDAFIVTATKTGTLPPNLDASNALAALAREMEHPQPEPVRPLPEIARRISGRMYRLDKPVEGVTTLGFTFKNENQYSIMVETPIGRQELPVGADGLFITSKTGADVPIAFRGRWTGESLDARSFSLEMIRVGEPLRFSADFTFDEDHLSLLGRVTPTFDYVSTRGTMAPRQ